MSPRSGSGRFCGKLQRVTVAHLEALEIFRCIDVNQEMLVVGIESLDLLRMLCDPLAAAEVHITRENLLAQSGVEYDRITALAIDVGHNDRHRRPGTGDVGGTLRTTFLECADQR